VKTAVVVALMVGCAGTAHAQRAYSTARICQQLRPTETPIVDLYTFEVGGEVFEKFGHAMMCLTYPDQVPVCFNYGITNFDDPAALVWGFMQSKQKFWVDGERLDSMLAFYGSARASDFAHLPENVPTSPGGCLVMEQADGTCGRGGDGEDRTVWRQRLPLTDGQARAVADKLCTDTEPANKYYIYHHFNDNCTTRLRDLVDKTFDGKLKEGSDKPFPETFREFGRSGLAEYEPLIAFSDFITGRHLDRHPTEWQAMFHPNVLRQVIADKLGIQPELVYQRKGPPYATSGPSGRIWVVLIALLFSAPLALWKWKGWRRERIAVAFASLPLVLLGLLLWTMFFVVTIDWVRWNEAMFLFLPIDLALPILGPRRREQYARVRLAMVVLVSLLCAVGLFRQPLWTPIITAFLPFALMANLRSPASRLTTAIDRLGRRGSPAVPARNEAPEEPGPNYRPSSDG
jgi:hypothetical protein